MKTNTIDNSIFNSTDELREYLEEQRHEGTTFFENPSFVKAITGITESGQLIYDYEPYYAGEYGWEYDDAVDWIEENTLRTIPYMGSVHPIVSLPINW